MKSLIILVLFIAIHFSSAAQINWNIDRRIERAVDKKVDNGIDRSIDAGTNKAENGIRKGGKKTIDNSKEKNSTSKKSTSSQDEEDVIGKPSTDKSSGYKPAILAHAKVIGKWTIVSIDGDVLQNKNTTFDFMENNYAKFTKGKGPKDEVTNGMENSKYNYDVVSKNGKNYIGMNETGDEMMMYCKIIKLTDTNLSFLFMGATFVLKK